MPHTFVLGCFHLTPTILYVFTPFGDMPALEIFFICRFVFQPFGEAPATPFASSFSSVCRYAIFPRSAIICHCSALSRPSVRPTNHPTKTPLSTWRCICATVCRYICATVCRCTNAFVCRYMRPQNMFQQICIAFAQYSAQP